MKKTISGPSDHALIEPSKRKYVLNVCLVVLAATALIGSFVVLFRHRQVSTSKTGQSSTASAIPDSFSFSHIQTVAIAHGTLYTSDGSHYLYAIQMQSGTEKHYYFDQIASPPIVDQDILYMEVGNAKDANIHMQAWRLSDGAISPLWSYPMTSVMHSTFIVASGVMYVFAGGPIGSIFALNATTGTHLWNYPTNGPFGVSLTVANGILYAGMDSSSRRGGVYAFRANTGKLLWKSQQGGGMMSAPVVVNGAVYTASIDRSLYAFNAVTGALLWHYTTDYAILWSPVVRNGVIYVGTGNNSVYALQVKGGSLLWHQRMDKLSYPLPNVPNRYFGVFVGAVDTNTVYVGSEGSYMVALRVSDGSLAWHRQFNGLVISPFAVENDVVYASSQDNYGHKSAIYALRSNDGGQLWRTPTGLLQPTPIPTPTAESGDSGGIPLTKAGIPAFTAADVEQYFAKHPTLTTADKPGKIVKIEFITSKEASVLMRGESTGLPDDALVCYVELHGPFVLDVSVPPGAKLPHSQNVYYIFDAQTAKSLVFGTVG